MQKILQFSLFCLLVILNLYFLLCIVSQFKRVTMNVIFSSLMSVSTLFLIVSFQYFNSFNPMVLGLLSFGITALLIVGTDELELRVKKKVAFKLPFLGILSTIMIPHPSNLFVLIGVLIINLIITYKNKERFRLYFRNYLLFLIFLLPVCFFFYFEVPVLFSFIFLGFCLYYLHQLMNLILVKSYLKESLE